MKTCEQIYSPTNVNSMIVRKENKLIKINKIFHKTLSICLELSFFAAASSAFIRVTICF